MPTQLIIMNKIVKLMISLAGSCEQEQVLLATSILNKGGVLALPTDTIYGLAARVNDTSALNKIYKIKGRDLTKPLAVCVADHEHIEEIADTSHLPKRLLSCLLPGPVTVLLNRTSLLNAECNPGIATVGVRIPDHNFVRHVARQCGPLALTSANRSGETSPITAEEFEDIWDELDLVFDGGLLHNHILPGADYRDQRLGSTVVDLTTEKFYTIIREGYSARRVTSILKRFGYRPRKT